MRARLNLAAAGLTEAGWRERWEAARLFLTADGEKGKAWGNETIRWNPDEDWLEVKLPAPLAHLANRPHGRYRLSCPVEFSYRGDEVAAQAAAGRGPLRHLLRPGSGAAGTLDASWKARRGPVPSLDELRASPVVAVDVNAGHLAVAVVAPDGNVTGDAVHHPAGPRRAARGRPRRPRPRRRSAPDRHRQGARGAGRRDRGPRLRRGPRRGPREHREPALARQARAGVPAARRGHPHRPVPGPAHPDDRQRRPARRGRRPGLHQPLGGAALARPPARGPPRALPVTTLRRW